MSNTPAKQLVGGAVVVAVGLGFYFGVAKNGMPLGLGLGLGVGLPLWRKIRRKKKVVRVYMDGYFDMMHYGHCNALRQARALGDQLVVGVVSDVEIIANKGPSVTPLHERMIMVKAVKWVDEVIYEVIHGDNPCILPNATDIIKNWMKCFYT